MKYLCLVYLDEKRLGELPDEDCVAFDTGIRKSHREFGGRAVHGAETKEQLAGFYMIEAKDLDEAIRLASRIPPARVGSIEVRPIRPIRETVAAHQRQSRQEEKQS